MARYGMGDGCKSFSISKSIDPEMCMDAFVPNNPVVYSKETDILYVYRISAIRGIVSSWGSKNNNAEGVYPKDYYDIHPGDQYTGICIELDEFMLNPDDIRNDELEPNMVDREFYKTSLVIEISDELDCSENWGAMLSEDDLSRFVGSKLLEIYFTDTSMNTEYLQTISGYNYSFDYHNVQFINIKTDKGTFQFTVYNCHNGYYGHEVSVKLDDHTLYSGII